MGRDKALLPYRGGTLAGAVAREVEAAAGSVVLVGRVEGVEGFRAIPDHYPGEGPLGGILTALEHTAAEWNLIVACDMPGISTPLLRELLDRADGDGLVPLGPSGLPEPLCAVYHRRLRPVIEAAFGRGVRKVTDAFPDSVRLIPLAGAFQNVNTPEDWAAYVE
jgi:molybdopterin-guanine dinucleotide biosynthesis protein A